MATLGPGGPDVLVGFTSDRAQTIEAVAGLGMAKGERLRILWAWPGTWHAGPQTTGGVEVLDDPSGARSIAPSGLDPDYLRDMFYLRQRNDQATYARLVGNHVSGLDALAKLLDSVQGRKQIILFSAGYDQSVIGGVSGAERQASTAAVTEGRLWEVTSEGHFGDVSGALRPGRALPRSRGGRRGDPHRGRGRAGGEHRRQRGHKHADRPRPRLPGPARRRLRRPSLLKEVNDVTAALGQVAAASRYFYVVGIAPSDEAKPGRPRKLAVKVRRPGLKATARTAYSVKPASAPAHGTEARVSMGESIAKGLSGGAFGLHALVLPTRAADGTVRLPVVLEVDGSELLTGVSEAKLPLEVYGYVMDAEGRIVDAMVASPTLDLARPAASSRETSFNSWLSSRPPRAKPTSASSSATPRADALRRSGSWPRRTGVPGPGRCLRRS